MAAVLAIACGSSELDSQFLVHDPLTLLNILCWSVSMFITELTPLVKELAQQPIAFMGGLFSGAFRLNLTDDPVKSWLDKQLGAPSTAASPSQNGKSGGPQSIAID